MNPSGNRPLAGMRVLDVSFLAAGPWTGALLGMLGAEVIKIESPAGDGARWLAPMQRGSDMGAYFMSMNFNKQDICLDLKSPEGYKQAVDLAATCDVFVQNFRVGVIDRLKLDYESLRRVNPRIVYCAISGYGEAGPMAKMGCIDATMQAFSGFACGNGAPGDELEAFRFTGLVDLSTASVATEAVLAALLQRDVTGVGQKVEVSMFEAALELQFSRISDLLGAGVLPAPRGSESAGLAPDRAFQALDQEIFVTAHDNRQWAGLCNALGRPELAEDARFGSNVLRVQNKAALHAALEPVFVTRPAIWWLRVLQRNGVPAAIAHNFETFRHHQQIVENRMIAQVTTPDWGEVSVGWPWHFSQAPTAEHVPIQISARFKQNNAAVLARLASLPARTPVRTGATGLAGLKVVELAQGIAGPLAALRLSDLGAEVIKVETPEGDWLRGNAPAMPGTTTSAAFVELNRGKRSVVPGTAPQGLLTELLRTADVLITDRSDEELRALGIEGLDREPFALNPRLVVASVSAWGERGPLRAHPGSELGAQAMAGYTRYLGEQGKPAVRLGADVASVGTGIFTCQAILAALLWRNISGQGQRVSLSLLNSLLALKSIHLACQSDPDAYIGPRVGAPNIPPDRGWRAGDRRFYFTFGGAVGADGRPGWIEFVKEVGLPHLLEDPRFEKSGRNSTGHGTNSHELHHEYEHAFVRYKSDDLVALVRKYMGTAGAYQSAEQALEAAQAKALNIVRTVAAGGRQFKVRAFPARFSAMDPLLKAGAPELGADTDAVAAELGVGKTRRAASGT